MCIFWGVYKWKLRENSCHCKINHNICNINTLAFRKDTHWETIVDNFVNSLLVCLPSFSGSLKWTQVAKLSLDNLSALRSDEIVVNYARGIKTSRPRLGGSDGVILRVCVKNVGPYNWLQSSPNSLRRPQPRRDFTDNHLLGLYQNKDTNWATCGPPSERLTTHLTCKWRDFHKGACWRLARLLTSRGLDCSSSGYVTLWKHWRCLGILKRWRKKEQSSNDDRGTRRKAQGLIYKYDTPVSQTVSDCIAAFKKW